MVDILKIFIGCDPRQLISLNVLVNSIYRRASKPVSITPLVIETLPLKRTGLTPFTYSRFLAPYLCNYEGWSLFLDADILLNCDINEIFALKNDDYAVMVSKNVKKFEWASVMLFNNPKCKVLTPEYIENAPRLHDCSWAEDSVGDIPREYNHLVGYDKPNPDAKLIHYTQGVPAFPETNDCEHAQAWFEEHKLMNSAKSWLELMGNSVHAAQLQDGTRVPKYKVKEVVNA